MSDVSAIRNLADLIRDLGVDTRRILVQPAPGTAVERDLIGMNERGDRRVELIDGVLVEKAMGFEESVVASVVSFLLNQHVLPRRLGVVAGSDGLVRYREGVVQLADVAFFSWKRFPNGKLSGEAISNVTPDLVVEVLSPSNTEAEMARKLNEYFDAGVKLVWLVDHRKRTVGVYRSVANHQILHADDTIDGGSVLPGFHAKVNEFFEGLQPE